MKFDFPLKSKAFEEPVEVGERYDPGDVKTTLNDAMKEILKKDMGYELNFAWDNLYLLIGYIGTSTLCFTTAWAFDKDFWMAKEYLTYSLIVYILYCAYSWYFGLPKDMAVAAVGIKSGKTISVISHFGLSTNFIYKYYFFTLPESGVYHPYKNRGELLYATEFSIGDVFTEKGQLNANAFLKSLNSESKKSK